MKSIVESALLQNYVYQFLYSVTLKTVQSYQIIRHKYEIVVIDYILIKFWIWNILCTQNLALKQKAS